MYPKVGQENGCIEQAHVTTVVSFIKAHGRFRIKKKRKEFNINIFNLDDM